MSKTGTPTSTTPDGSTDSDLDFDEEIGVAGDGELKVLLGTLETESAPLTEKLEKALSESLMPKGLSRESAYGHPLSAEEAVKRVPPGDGGIQWHSLLINADNPFNDDGTLRRGLSPRDFDMEKKTIKPRRASLPVLAKDFYSSLTRVEGPKGPRFIFHGILNGWPSLQTFEVLKLERKRDKISVRPAHIFAGQRVWAPMWDATKEGAQGIDPIIKEKGLLFRITFRGPPWSSKGWSQDSPGFNFWYEGQLKPEPALTYGTQAIEKVDKGSICTMVHMFAHRYARIKENPKDILTYHSVVLLEWNHGQYCTIVESAYLNGIAGYCGKSNFYHDLNEPCTQLYKCFPPHLVCPWLTNAAEIRAFDIEAKSFEEFKQYVKQYEGRAKRFLDPQFPFSHPARLTYRSKKNIAQYLNNYIRRDISYNELTRNCQTLSADLCNFLAGKKDVVPFHPVNRIDYKVRTYLFLYEPEMYDLRQRRESIQANELRS